MNGEWMVQPVAHDGDGNIGVVDDDDQADVFGLYWMPHNGMVEWQGDMATKWLAEHVVNHLNSLGYGPGGIEA